MTNEPEPEFLQIFCDEANERLDSIVSSLLAIEKGNSDPDVIDALFRDAHTIKGAAGMIGLDAVRALAHAVEDVLEATRTLNHFPLELIEPLLRSADALRDQVNGGTEPHSELIVELAGAAMGLREEEKEEAPAASEPASPEPELPQVAEKDKRSIRVRAEKLDRLLDLAGETVLHRQRLEHMLAQSSTEQSEELADELDVGDRLLSELQDAAIQTRTLPLSSIAGSFPRAVRDIAAEQGKNVELTIKGAETQLDRVILESLTEPLTHILRNAVAHGIETPKERKKAGKPAVGSVVLEAEQRGGQVAVIVGDDGRGVSAEILDQTQRFGSLAEVLSQPGFSTRGDVDDLAGRGVGLDAVKTHVESFGGSLDVQSESGSGTRVILLLPLTLALLDVLLVERGDQIFGLPLASVQEAVSVTETLALVGKGALELRGQAIPLADLAELLGTKAPEPSAKAPPALIIGAGGRRIAAICDRLIGEEQVVVKSLGGLLQGIAGYLGGAILGDGRIALLLDPAMLTRASGRTHKPTVQTAVEGNATAPTLLVVEDSLTVRELQRSILEAAGYKVHTARNGRDALDRLAADNEIGLVVTDVEMPEMNGFELTETIRSQPERASLPVIVVTTLASEEDRRRGIEAGADAYMVKRNFDQQALLETVDRLVGH